MPYEPPASQNRGRLLGRGGISAERVAAAVAALSAPSAAPAELVGLPLHHPSVFLAAARRRPLEATLACSLWALAARGPHRLVAFGGGGGSLCAMDRRSWVQVVVGLDRPTPRRWARVMPALGNELGRRPMGPFESEAELEATLAALCSRRPGQRALASLLAHLAAGAGAGRHDSTYHLAQAELARLGQPIALIEAMAERRRREMGWRPATTPDQDLAGAAEVLDSLGAGELEVVAGLAAEWQSSFAELVEAARLLDRSA